MAQNAIPPNVNLAKTTPEAVPAYTRRFKSIATNQQTFTQQSYVNITLDTSTAGSFVDPLQSYLKFDLQLNNTNPFIDYCSFGSAGAAAVIEEFRIFNQGTPVEEILYYNNLCEFMMDFMGQTIKPLHMYKPSKIRQPVSEVHSVNAIKAPMVNLAGSAMHCQSISSTYIRNNYSSVWTFQNDTTLGTSAPILLGTSAPFSYELNYATAMSANPMLTSQIAQGLYPPSNPLSTMTDNFEPLTYSALQGYFNANVNALTVMQGVNTDNTNGVLDSGATTISFDTNLGTAGFVTQTAYNSTLIGNKSSNISNTIPYLAPSSNVFGNTAQIFMDPDYNPANPLNWPFVMPNDSDYYNDNGIGSNNLQDYFMYLSNVKEIPVGIPGSQRGDGQNQFTTGPSNYELFSLNFQNSAALPSTASYSATYTCCLPLLSGLFGSMAEKCFPTMLAAPGSLYFQLRLATNEKALQVSMDPCRRVLGTTRDYVPFGGSIGSIYGAYSAGGLISQKLSTANSYGGNVTAYQGGAVSCLGNRFYNVGTTGVTAVSERNYGFYDVSSNLANVPAISTTQLAPSGFLIDSFVGNVAFGQAFGVNLTVPIGIDRIDRAASNGCTTGATVSTPGSLSSTAGVPVNHPVLGNPFSVIGANLLAVQGRLKSTSLQSSASILFSPYSIAAMEGYWTGINFVEAEQSNLFTSFQQPTAPTRNAFFGQGLQLSDGVALSAANWGGGVAIGTNNIQYKTFNTFIQNTTALTGFSKMYGTDLGYVSAAPYDGLSNQAIVQQPYFPLQCNLNYGTQLFNNGIIGTSAASDAKNTMLVLAAPATLTSLNSGMYGGLAAATYGEDQIENTSGSNYNSAGVAAATVSGVPTTGGMTSHTRLQMNPGGIPLPQYVLVDQPWLLKEFSATLVNGTSLGFYKPYAAVGAAVTAQNVKSEAYACYGTFLEHSRAQSMRCFSCPVGGNKNLLTYTLRNVEFVGQQIVLPEAITSSILEMAAGGGDISIYTTSIRSYLVTLQESTTQNIIIPAKIASANSLFITFAPTNYTAGSGYDAQLYNSLSRFCPFSKISNASATTKTTTASINGMTRETGLGFTTQYTTINTPAGSGVFEIQLRLGNELIPQQPLTAVSEIIAELLKCGHKLFDTEAKMNTTFSLTTAAGLSASNLRSDTGANILNGADPSQGLYFDSFRNRDFTTAFTPAAWLDDQTFINNPNVNYIAACANIGSNSFVTPKQSALWGVRNQNILPFFIPNESTFAIGFDLDTWSKYSDVARSGKFLGNNTITLYMTNCTGFSGWASSGINGVVMYAFVPHDLRLSFQAGGSLVAYF